VTRQPVFQIRQIVLDELVDELDDTLAIPARGDPVRPFLDEGQGVAHGHAVASAPVAFRVRVWQITS